MGGDAGVAVAGVTPEDAGWGKHSESTAPALPPGGWRVGGDCAYAGFLLS